MLCQRQGVGQMKQTEARKRIEARLVDAERRCRCLVPADNAERELLRRAMRAEEVVRPFTGMYMRSATWTALADKPRMRWRYIQNTYTDLHPQEVLCSFSAALDYGLWVSKRHLDAIHIASCGQGHGRRGPEIHRHECRVEDVDMDGAVLRTTIERTVLDCSVSVPFEDALAIADSAARFCGLDADAFCRYLDRAGKGRHGIAKAYRVAQYMDGRSESGGESIVRAKIIDLGFAPPTLLQAEFVDPIDGGLIRVDMYYELDNGFRLIVEVDGMGKYGSANDFGAEIRRRLVAERQRESHISALGIPVMRVQFSRVYEAGYLEHLLESFGVPRAGA